ncbi:hypothetical protein P1P70_21640 [Streptomyces sp. MB09-02B]|nr:hypothetical protein [Streptomyces sp. MB09-02B]
MLQVSLKAVDNWWAKWLAGGREALEAQPRGRRVGEHQVLDAVEQQATRQAVLDHRHCELGLAGQLWQRVLSERDVRDQHQGPDALHSVHRDLDADVMCRFLTGSRALRPQGAPRCGRPLRPPLPQGQRLAR